MKDNNIEIQRKGFVYKVQDTYSIAIYDAISKEFIGVYFSGYEITSKKELKEIASVIKI